MLCINPIKSYLNNGYPVFNKAYETKTAQDKTVDYDTLTFTSKKPENKIHSKTGETITIRELSCPREPLKHNVKNVILYIPGINLNDSGLSLDNSECLMPFKDKNLLKNSVVYGLDRSYVKINEKPKLEDFKKLSIQVQEAINFISKKHKKPVSLVGYSFGGMISANLATHNPKNVKNILLISPGFFDKETLNQAVKGYEKESKDPVLQFFEKACKISFAIQKRFSKIKVPITVVTGDMEPTCSMGHMKRIMNSFKSNDKRLVVLNGEAHELTQEVLDKQVLSTFAKCAKVLHRI